MTTTAQSKPVGGLKKGIYARTRVRWNCGGCCIMNKGKAGIFAHIKRLIFVMAIMVGLMLLSGEGGGFLRIFVACCFFVFAWGCWDNWEAVRELEQEQEQEQDSDKW